MENPIKMDDLGVPLFSETPIVIFPQTMVTFTQVVQVHSPKQQTNHPSIGGNKSQKSITQTAWKNMNTT